MPAHPDDRDALIRESRRVRSALDDLADLAGLTGGTRPPAVSAESLRVPVDAVAPFDSPDQTPLEVELVSLVDDVVADPVPVQPADDMGWFDDPPLAPIMPSGRSTAEVQIVTPSEEHDTRQSSPADPPTDSPTADSSISEVLDDFDW